MREWLTAILFSIVIPICPILAVILIPPPGGGIFIVGFVMGVAFLPLIILGTIHAAATLFSNPLLQGVWGIIAYLMGVIVISALAAAWSFYSAT